MKTLTKKVMSFITSFAVIFTMVIVEPIIVNAAYETPNYSTPVSSYSDLQARMNVLIQKYTGTYWTTNGAAANSSGTTSKQYWGIQCNGFAKYIFNDLFCTGNIGSYDSNKYYFPSPNGAVLIDKSWNFGSTDTATVKGILTRANIGDLVQVRRRGKDYGHTMIITGVYDDGISIFDCNSDGKCGVKHYRQSYSDFASKNIGMSLYHSTKYPPVNSPTPTPDSVPTVTIDNISGGEGTISINGWIANTNNWEHTCDGYVYIGNDCIAIFKADKDSTDVGKHRYEQIISTSYRGTQTIRIEGVNTVTGAIGKVEKKVTINDLPNNPEIAIDSISGGEGTINMNGWIIDKNNWAITCEAYIYIGNDCIANFKADKDSTDVGKHRFEKVIRTKYRGNQNINIEAVNPANGKITKITKNVEIKDSPTISIDNISGGEGTINMNGWIIDKNDWSVICEAYVYIGNDCIAKFNCDKDSDDVGKHRFEKVISTKYRGKQTIRIEGVNPKTGEITKINKEVIIKETSTITAKVTTGL